MSITYKLPFRVAPLLSAMTIGGALVLSAACSSDSEPGMPGQGSGGSGGLGSGGAESGTGATGPGTGGASAGGSTMTGGDGAGASGGQSPIGSGGSGGDIGTGGMMGADEEYPVPGSLPDETGASLWLRYPQVPIPMRLADYQSAFTHVVHTSASPSLDAAAEELVLGLSGLVGMTVSEADAPSGPGAVVVGTPTSSTIIGELALPNLEALGPEGYLVQRIDYQGQSITVVAGNTEVGALYGSFALLRHLQSHNAIDELALSGSPKIEHRVLNHWDNLDRSVERGYAGQSLWEWNALPGTLSPRYKDYARANASIGINGTVLTNVNATKNNNEDMWGAQRATYFNKVKALADVFRPYGIRVYLTAPFNAGGTANPNDASTQQWWRDAMDQIYDLIPDFGGLLIKASSEGEPGPSNGATHADGANMLADAIGDRGIVMWRAFVYGENLAADRIAQAYNEFKPLDGQFASNVLVQPKNGPLDFQPREPFHPLFGAMPNTPLALELQVTKEYLGQDTHLAYLGTYYEEVLQADTYAKGAGSTVARVVDGSVDSYSVTAMAGVANIGSDTNWTGSQFNQANWYVYGRMAWDPELSAAAVAEEWVRQTFSNDPVVVGPVVQMMMDSREHLVHYMTPLGLVHIMATDHHYGPGPWVNNLTRAEWNPFYYHEADMQGIGFDRTASGSNAISQYAPEVQQMFGNADTIPEEYLLFFHRVGWDFQMESGRSLWDEMVHLYSLGVDGVADMKTKWAGVDGRVDSARFAEVSQFLDIQHYEARWWRDACLTYFASRSGETIPAGYSQPANNLAFYQNLTCPANVDKPRCPQIEMGSPSPAITP